MEDPSRDEAGENFLLIWARNDSAEFFPMQITQACCPYKKEKKKKKRRELGMLERDLNTYYLRNYIKKNDGHF